MASVVQDNIGKLRARYSALEQREQVALTSLAVFFTGLFIVFGVWFPANDFFEARRADRDRQFELLQYMRSTEQEARTLGDQSPRVGGGQDLLTQISRTAAQAGITPSRLQPEGDSGVSVFFDGVAFNDLMRWLQTQTEAGVSIRQMSVDREESAGMVKARIVLRGG